MKSPSAHTEGLMSVNSSGIASIQHLPLPRLNSHRLIPRRRQTQEMPTTQAAWGSESLWSVLISSCVMTRRRMWEHWFISASFLLLPWYDRIVSCSARKAHIAKCPTHLFLFGMFRLRSIINTVFACNWYNSCPCREVMLRILFFRQIGDQTFRVSLSLKKTSF